MTTIVNILTDRYADWECALTMAVGRSFYGLNIVTASPGGHPVTSAGGLRVPPDMAVEELQPGRFDLLMINGGGIWESEDRPDISGLVKKTHTAGKPVAAICGATLALAETGLLDNVRHTSNGAEYLEQVPAYRGSAHYVESASAVTGGNIITAAGTSPVSFMREIMRRLGRGGPELDYYVSLHAAEHRQVA